MSTQSSWEHFLSRLYVFPLINMSVDISRMNFPDDFFQVMEPIAQAAFDQMKEVEAGGIANPDEGRMVGHYWLRAPHMAPDRDITEEIIKMNTAVVSFTSGIRSGAITAVDGSRFSHLLVVGIGGSALGPQLLADALAKPGNGITPYFLDNTDPDGIDRIFSQLGDNISTTLVLVISKSGGTKETRNGLVEVQSHWKREGIPFQQHAVAITGQGSALDQQAAKEGWLARFPMWDWVGGRTSITSAVGLVPAGLTGIDIMELLRGAAACDSVTRASRIADNPSMLLALMWHYATNGKGEKDMVVLPYKDRLALFPRYLQQLIMESLGKEKNLIGQTVHQGLTVYGNKGSTDQHAYVQQLREGVNNFFVTFIRILKDRSGTSPDVESTRKSGDYLHGFLLGTRQALSENKRESITITMGVVDAYSLGVLIALYERAVGLYAAMIGINAYHQPGVEAGKIAAETILQTQAAVISLLKSTDTPQSVTEIARHLGMTGNEEIIHLLLEHLQSNPPEGRTLTATSDHLLCRRYTLC